MANAESELADFKSDLLLDTDDHTPEELDKNTPIKYIPKLIEEITSSNDTI